MFGYRPPTPYRVQAWTMTDVAQVTVREIRAYFESRQRTLRERQPVDNTARKWRDDELARNKDLLDRCDRITEDLSLLLAAMIPMTRGERGIPVTEAVKLVIEPLQHELEHLAKEQG